MRDLMRSTFTWRLVGGFVLGTAGMLAIHATAAMGTQPDRPATITHVTR